MQQATSGPSTTRATLPPVPLRLLAGERELFRATELDICNEACSLYHGMVCGTVLCPDVLLGLFKLGSCGVTTDRVHAAHSAWHHNGCSFKMDHLHCA